MGAKVSGLKASYTYNGKAQKPSVTVKLGSDKLKKDTDYTLSYKNNKKAGKASIEIKGIGNYSGTVTKTGNGVETVTIQNLEVVKVDPELNMLVVRGAVPGPKNGLVTIKTTVKVHKVKQAGAGISVNPQKASGRNPQKASARTK